MASIAASAHVAGNATAILGEEVAPAFATRPVPLKGHAGALALLALGVAVAAVGVALLFDAEPGPAFGVIPVGLAIAFGGVVLLVRRVRGNCSVALHERGVVVTRKGRAQILAFERITATFARERDILFNGMRAGKMRHVRIEVGPESTEVGHFSPFAEEGGEADPFGEYFGAILLGRVQAAREGLKGGKAITGKGWSLGHTGLRLADGTQLSFAELGAAYVHDNAMSVWKRAEETPTLTVPEASRDAYTLLWVVRFALEEAGADTTVPGLGRLLFSRSENKHLGIALLGLSLLFLVPGIVLLVAGLLGDDSALPAGLGWTALGTPVAVAGVVGFWVRLYFHERGVAKRGLFGRRRVPFSELTGLVHKETIHYYNGAYAGTGVKAHFIPERGKPIKLSLSIRGSDEDLEAIRDAATATIADRMATELEDKGSVPWVSATLTPDGVAGLAPKLVGRGERRVLPYDDTLLYRFNGGVLELFTGGEKKPGLKIKVAGLNFYPGFELFLRLAGASVELDEGEGDEAEE